MGSNQETPAWFAHIRVSGLYVPHKLHGLRYLTERAKIGQNPYIQGIKRAGMVVVLCPQDMRNTARSSSTRGNPPLIKQTPIDELTRCAAEICRSQ